MTQEVSELKGAKITCVGDSISKPVPIRTNDGHRGEKAVVKKGVCVVDRNYRWKNG